ncbi:MAG: SET domain-containing protein [Acidobacteriota bacterium]
MSKKRPEVTVDDRLEVRESSIHGKGLFAKEKIEKGCFLGEYEGERVKKDGMHVLWVEDEKKGWVGIRGRNKLRFLNHSRKPNAELDGPEVYALRKIKRDEELTIHYGDEWENDD